MHSHSDLLSSLSRLDLNAYYVLRVTLIACAFALSACSRMEISNPKDQNTVGSGPVSVLVRFSNSGYSSFSASLDGVDRISSFALDYKQAADRFTLAPGSHRLIASAEVYDTFYKRNVAHTVSSRFAVPIPTFTLSSSASVVLRRHGGSANLSASITPVGGFSEAVDLSVPNLPPDVAAGTTTMPRGLTTEQITLTATGGADDGNRTLTLSARGGEVVATRTFSLYVFHATGPFARASFAVTTSPQTAVSPGGAVQLSARRGSAEGLPSAFAAVYERQGGVGRLGQPVPFNHGQTNVMNQAFGGAGFCAGSNAGFVIAGKGPGVTAPNSAQYVASVLEFTNPLLIGQADIAAFRSQGNMYYFEPALYFSPGCRLAIAVGAHPMGPANNLAQVIDLKTSRVINNVEFSNPSFTASIVDVGTRQRIEFTSGERTQFVNLS